MRVVDGRGKIVPDAFAEIRLVNLPPAVSAVRTFPFFRTQMAPSGVNADKCSLTSRAGTRTLPSSQILILFNRNHNVSVV